MPFTPIRRPCFSVEWWVGRRNESGPACGVRNCTDNCSGHGTCDTRLGECKCVRYGQQSETLQSFTFNPHSAWLCFSVETAAGRTFDFAATNEADAHTWVCGLSALIGAEIDHGWLMWKALEMKMKEEVTTASTRKPSVAVDEAASR